MDTDAATMNAPAAVLRFNIGGMTCVSCSARAERALGKVPGVTSATVSRATEHGLSVHHLLTGRTGHEMGHLYFEAPGCGRHQHLRPHDTQDPPEPVLGARLQRRRRRDGGLERQRRFEYISAAALEAAGLQVRDA